MESIIEENYETFDGLSVEKNDDIVIEEGFEESLSNLDYDASDERICEEVVEANNLGLIPDFLLASYQENLTHAEIVALIIFVYEKLYGEILVEEPFDDLKDVIISKAEIKDILTPEVGDWFSPEDITTKEQAALLLTNIIRNHEYTEFKLETIFDDYTDISEWAKTAVAITHKLEIIPYIENRFEPQTTFTREQGIIAILRVYKILINEESGSMDIE